MLLSRAGTTTEKELESSHSPRRENSYAPRDISLAWVVDMVSTLLFYVYFFCVYSLGSWRERCRDLLVRTTVILYPLHAGFGNNFDRIRRVVKIRCGSRSQLILNPPGRPNSSLRAQQQLNS